MRRRPPKRKLTPEQEKAAEAFINGAKSPATPAQDRVEKEGSDLERSEQEGSTQEAPRATAEDSRQNAATSTKEVSAEKPAPVDAAAAPEPQPEYPWEKPYVREDVIKGYSLRLPEPLYLKLKYLSNQTGQSMNEICKQAVRGVIEQELGSEIEPRKQRDR